MSMETVEAYIVQYGYMVIFVALFFGIVGIPAPEESFLFLIGLMAASSQLHVLTSSLSAVGGALAGMAIAYLAGRFFGMALIRKFGKYVGLTDEKVAVFQEKFRRRAVWTVFLGFFLPGLRQASPYIAGMLKMEGKRFIVTSIIGAITWIGLYIGLGFLSATYLPIKAEYVPYMGLAFLVILLVQVIRNAYKKKRNGGAST
ncbi:DedA family protein [Sporosarcina sp. Te-1]|uniref:DedA family protein n=1 Tax=Sporosarcina sp. Te-1 TaxID=2818390 RepID=UPI001AA00802|nr:DedA family protein [Sporosarcina sp. Te-1]QTD40760.1 DedA family protein [Sporosarcina sp. Te-1]